MQMGYRIAKRGEVHFLRRERFAQHRFHRNDSVHAEFPLRLEKVRKFGDMCIPDDTVKSGKAHLDRLNYAKFFMPKNQQAVVSVAKRAVTNFHAAA